MRSIVIESQNLKLFNFQEVYRSSELCIVNNLSQLDLIRDNRVDFTKQDTKKIILHYVIEKLCESIINCTRSGKSIIYVPITSCYSGSELLEYSDIEAFTKMLKYVVRSIRINIPIQVFEYNLDYDKILQLRNGEQVDFSVALTNFFNKKQRQEVSLQKLKKFLSKLELSSLQKTFESEMKSKHLLFK